MGDTLCGIFPSGGDAMNVMDRYKKIITGKNVIIALLLYYGCFMLLYLPDSPVNRIALRNIPIEKVPDLQKNGYSSEAVQEYLTILEDNGRADYLRNLWTLDVIMPLLSAMSTLLLFMYCLKKTDFLYRWRTMFAVVPVFALIADLTENTLLTITTLSYPKSNATIVTASGIITRAKWMGITACGLISIILLLLFIILILYKKIRIPHR